MLSMWGKGHKAEKMQAAKAGLEQLRRRPPLRTASALLLLAGAALSGCSSLPSLRDRPVTTAIGAEAGTRLHDALAPLTEQHPGKSGIFALDDPHAAFAARVALANAAQRSLDVQYYIWNEDVSGKLMLEAVRQAADRGVRVRLLLDDNNTKGMDPTLAALNAHSNVELRLFNPFANRSMRVWGYMTDFSRLNRRMHNKSFTADGVATIIGGRNIGDEYFGAGDGVGFIDLDVIAVGAVVAAVQKSFDEYWNSASAYPAERMLPAPTPEQLARFAAQGAETGAQPDAQQYLEDVRNTGIVRDMIARAMSWEWCEAQLIVDDPAKALDKAEHADYLLADLERVLGSPQRDLYVVSPYLVPMKTGVAGFKKMRARGVKVAILTNALEATDVAAVHAGYSKARKELLRSGVELWELKRTAVSVPLGQPPPRKRSYQGSSGSGSSGSSSGASLHAKTFAVDDARIFVGSFNFDPRSASLNTEMGLVISSPVLAGRVAAAFDAKIPAAAYAVHLTPEDKLEWVERGAQGDIVHHSEPNSSGWRRFSVGFLSLLPIDWLL
jgi:cardiolipin synthase C